MVDLSDFTYGKELWGGIKEEISFFQYNSFEAQDTPSCISAFVD
jgi:hypothetical protein